MMMAKKKRSQIKPRGGQPQVQEVQQEEEKEADNSATSLRVI